MTVDVVTEIVIDRPLATVAGYSSDPANAPAWYVNIDSVAWRSEPPASVGTLVTFVARFLGRRLEYTYEIVEFEPDRLLVMRTAEGPFPMETSYAWRPVDDHATRMALRNRGEPATFAKVVAPFIAPAMRRANRRDLATLKAILEATSDENVSTARPAD